MNLAKRVTPDELDRLHDAIVRNPAVLQKKQNLVRAQLAIAARDAHRLIGRADRDKIVLLQEVVVVDR